MAEKPCDQCVDLVWRSRGRLGYGPECVKCGQIFAPRARFHPEEPEATKCHSCDVLRAQLTEAKQTIERMTLVVEAARIEASRHDDEQPPRSCEVCVAIKNYDAPSPSTGGKETT